MNELQEIPAIINTVDNSVVLATLIQTIGSSYRRPGARMVFDRSKVHVGNISAGCLEADILARVESVVTNRSPQLANYDMGSDLDLVWGTGMGCQGNVKILLEYIAKKQVPHWIDSYIDMTKQRQTGVMATVFSLTGECDFASVGDHFIYNDKSKNILPNTGILAHIIEPVLQNSIQNSITSTTTIQIGNVTLDLLLEPILPPFALWIFGAGEHARPIASLAKKLGWYVGVIDHRPALATYERFPQVNKIVVGHPPESLAYLPLDQRSAVLIVSHIYEKDLEALRDLICKPVAYLGLQGNRKRSERLLRELVGLDKTELCGKYKNLHFPAGLDIGAETPEAIAVSMIAEIQAQFTGHQGGPLREKIGLIH